jgi:RNA polymerase sigma-70 factor (ECF subfamily)
VLVLRFREGFSYDVIASMVAERAGTLRVRLLRALPLLKGCLEGKGIDL